MIYLTAEVGFLQFSNHNQVVQHQQSNRSNLRYFIVPNQILSKMTASFCYIHSRSTTRWSRPCGTNVSSSWPKKLFFLVPCLLRLKTKIGNREKHQEKHGKYPKKPGKQQVKHEETYGEMGGQHYTRRISVPVFNPLHTYPD